MNIIERITNKTRGKILSKEEQENLLKSQLMRIQKYKFSKKIVYNSIIPLKIYQTWHTKNLPPIMKNNVEKLKYLHPRFEHFLFDDNDCRDFIKNNFNIEVLNAFDRLIPGAYKADLWRYCVLYQNGGIYLDIKYGSINSFRFIELTEKEHWVLDIDGNNIYNALIVVLPKNPILLKCINQIVLNVATRYYGNSSVDPTGPGLLSKFLKENDKKNIELQHIFNKPIDEKSIVYKNIAILRMYKGYYDEIIKFQKVEHYQVLWNAKHIYK
jgi:mannosyltransferase OCH1-like enzyme